MEDHVHQEKLRRGGTKLIDCWRARFAAIGARWDAHRALGQERRALARLGEALAGTTEQGGNGVCRALDEVAAHDLAIGQIQAALSASLQDDRADYAAVSPWMRPVVIARGLAARCVLRERVRRARKERAAACRRLGAAALVESFPMKGAAEETAAAARDARARAAAATRQVEELLTPLGGSVLPVAARHAEREVMALGTSLFKEVRGQLVPRVSALAGLAVGWWLASTFTDSQLSATLHSLGIGSGPRRAISSRTYRLLSFWLPVLAAALCSYAGGRLGAFVRSRYAPPAADASRTPPAGDPMRRAASEHPGLPASPEPPPPPVADS